MICCCRCFKVYSIVVLLHPFCDLTLPCSSSRNYAHSEILCNRASINGNNGPCGGYEFRDHATNPDKRKCMLHYTNNSGSGSRSRSGDVRRGDRMDGVDCYIKENQMCQLRLSPEGDFDRNNDRRCNTDSTTRKRSFRGARRSQCQAMCYTRPNGYNTGEEICTAFEFAETSPPRCVLYYNGSPRRGDRRDDLRCYIQNNNTN